jgi:hypothetical protein
MQKSVRNPIAGDRELHRMIMVACAALQAVSTTHLRRHQLAHTQQDLQHLVLCLPLATSWAAVPLQHGPEGIAFL